MERLQQWPRIKEIVGSALERPPAERGAYLDQACSNDPDLRAEVESLLSAYHDTRGLPPSPWPDAVADSGEQLKVIGPYRLLKELGFGGMGQVWLAEQTEPVRRQVAIKLIRAGMYDASTVQRFKAERQSLAMMDHPAIAKVFDAGTTPSGQPYFVMEYVDGLTITDYCDAKKLSIRERLQLFIRVCEGVQHAHQKAIIHRDLKPSNILVVEVDGKPVPRIIDFGLAKATTPPVPGETVFTQMGAFLGTPGYMSPEQTEVEQHDIDTRADVYSLGAILYELLTGFLPFDTTEWKKQRREEFLRKLREEDPPRPSARISASPENSESRAQARNTEIKQLAGTLRGDLDWIAMKALEKERNRRYGTPSELAADVERYLDDRAVEARPASASYRAKKFLARNKFAVASALAVFMALLAGLGVALWQARIARTEAQTSQAVQSFLADIFRANSIDQTDPIKGRKTTAAELLDIGASKIDRALGDAPEAKLRVLEILGQMYDELELNEQAATIHRKRIQLTRELRGPMAPALAQVLVRLAVSLRTSPAAEEREKALQEATRILDHNRDFSSRTRARLLVELANGCWDKDLPKALHLTGQAVKINQAYQPDRDAASALIQEGVFHTMLGQPDLAEVSYHGALTALDAIRPATNHDRSQIYTYLGQTQHELQKFDEAEKNQRLAFQVAEAVGGAEHQLTLIAQMDLGWFLFETGRSAEGLAFMSTAKDSILKTRGTDPQTVPYALNRYGRALLQFGRLQEGDSLLAKAEESLRKYRPGSGYLATVLDLRAAGLTDLGRYAEAQDLLGEASQIHANIHDEPIYINENLLSRSRLLLATGKPGEASKVLDGFYTKEALKGTISLTWARGSLMRAEVELASQRPDRAADLADSVRVAVERSPARAYLRNYEAQAALTEGKGLVQLHRQADALPLLRQAVKLSSELYDGGGSPILADAHATLAECLYRVGEHENAQSQLAQAKAIVAAQKQLGEHIRRPIAELQRRLTRTR